MNSNGDASVNDWAIGAKAFSEPADCCTVKTPSWRPLVERATPSAMLPATRSWRASSVRTPPRASASRMGVVG